MILKLLIFAIIGIVIYRFLGGRISFLNRNRREEAKSRDSDNDFTQVAPTSECSECGTYMTEYDAIIYHKKSYCSNECLEKAQKRLR